MNMIQHIWRNEWSVRHVAASCYSRERDAPGDPIPAPSPPPSPLPTPHDTDFASNASDVARRAMPSRPVSRPGARQTDPYGRDRQASTQPLGLGNWQLAHRSTVELRNQTGSDVHLVAGTLAT